MALVLATAFPAAARQLHWSAIDVEARLDADGRLRVRERQTMVLDGDWNGGERRFDLGVTQQIELHGLTRIDAAAGERVALAEGDLGRVDQFEWVDRKTLRWRSRLPSDPPFDRRSITYLLDYTVSGVLYESGSEYRLDHDFAFPDRPGLIRRFTLELELDPIWRESDLPQTVERTDLLPGAGVPVRGGLVYTGEGRPAGVPAAFPMPLRLALFGLALAAMAWLVARFGRHEADRGRYEPLDVPERLDRAWLDEHLFHLPAELVGALWDRKVGAPEVAATLARMVAEGKLASEVEERGRWRKKILKLELLVDRGSLQNHDERRLVDKLFFDGRRETDTEAVREHYKSKGLDLAALIRPTLMARVKVHLLEPARKRAHWPWYLLAAVPVLLLLEWANRGPSVWVVVSLLVIAAPIPIAVGSCLVVPYRRWTRRLAVGALGFVAPALALAGASWGAVLAGPGVVPDLIPGVFGVLALALLPVALPAIWLEMAKTRETADAVAYRYRLAAVRRAFARELEKPEPDLEDAWFPYLLAFGLDKQVGKWFASFGSERAAGSFTGAGAGTSAGGSASPSWTGGGGAFGGAGATASWGVAATGLAVGVAQPSSSGGGGGSFSGGGGGGGW